MVGVKRMMCTSRRCSVRAMKLFYRKHYSEQYPSLVTGLVLAGIQVRGWFRILKHQLK